MSSTVSKAQLDRPMFLRQLSTDEYRPQPYRREDEIVVARTAERLATASDERGRHVVELAHGRAGTAAGLRELNTQWGEVFYDVPEDAVRDEQAAADVFDGPEMVIDVQTHFMAPHGLKSFPRESLKELLSAVMPPWWHEMDEHMAWDLAYYMKNVFLETETTVAVLTSGPGLDDWRNVFNDEMFATRALVDSLAGTGRLLNHAVVHPNVDHDLAAMDEYASRFKPVGWKVYTMGVLGEQGPSNSWTLNDEAGRRFLDRARALDVKLVCAHKGVSWLAANGSPKDIGPAARDYPDLDFVIYHSGYEMTSFGAPEEGPFSDGNTEVGVDCLINTVLEAGIPKGGNVYAELGTTWFSLVRRPVEAAHVLGKLIAHLGEDNVIWGSDSIWYGSAQPLVEAFRAFQIPDRMCEEFGYRKLTPEVKNKILSLNAAAVYGIDVPAMRERAANDDLSWSRQIMRDYRENGFAGLR